MRVPITKNRCGIGTSRYRRKVFVNFAQRSVDTTVRYVMLPTYRGVYRFKGATNNRE